MAGLSRRIRERRSLLAAALLHGAWLAVVGALHRPAPSKAPSGAPAQALIELDLDSAVAAELPSELGASLPTALRTESDEAPSPPAARLPAAAPFGAGDAALSVAEAEGAAAEAEGVLDEGEDLSSVDPSATPGTADGVAPDRRPDLGLGSEAWQRWALLDRDRPAPAPTRRRRAQRFHPPPASSTGGLQEGLEAHDRALGLGPSGPVVNELYRAAHSDVAPQVGVARFLVTVLASGHVEVSLAEATDQVAGWNQVASRAAAALQKSPPPVPKPRQGMRLLVEITAEEVFPNGKRKKSLTDLHVEAQAPRVRSTEASQAELEAQNPVLRERGDAKGASAIVDLPGVFLAENGKVCSYKIGLSVLGPTLMGGCDLANAGAKAQRMVRTAVREQTLF